MGASPKTPHPSPLLVGEEGNGEAHTHHSWLLTFDGMVTRVRAKSVGGKE
jgi:hypothetical protein